MTPETSLAAALAMRGYRVGAVDAATQAGAGTE